MLGKKEKIVELKLVRGDNNMWDDGEKVSQKRGEILMNQM